MNGTCVSALLTWRERESWCCVELLAARNRRSRLRMWGSGRLFDHKTMRRWRLQGSTSELVARLADVMLTTGGGGIMVAVLTAVYFVDVLELEKRG